MAPSHLDSSWPPLPLAAWAETCDTLHAHSQVLGKLAARLAPPEPELQHAALRLSARGIETLPLPAPDRSGAVTVVLDLRMHHVVVEHSDSRVRHVSLTPDRPVGAVTREVLAAVHALAGPVSISMHPQEVAWTDPLDEDERHRTYDPDQVLAFHAAATRAALVLGALRAPYRGRSTPVNAWWGSFDLAVSLFSGRSATPTSDSFIGRNDGDAEQIGIGWWPGDARHRRAAFYGFAFPAPAGFADATIPSPGRWDATLGEYVLEWDDVVASDDPFGTALSFGRAVIGHACVVCEWDPALSASARGHVPAVH